MKHEEFEVGQKVIDRWFSLRPYGHWGIGTVKAVLKTRVKIFFPTLGELKTYDIPHLIFLDPVS